MRVFSVLRAMCGLAGLRVVLEGWDLDTGADRPVLTVRVRHRKRDRPRCGRCGGVAVIYDRGGGRRARRWRHLDAGFAMVYLEADTFRVDCPTHGPTVAQVAWARHGSRLSRAFEDLIVYDAVASSKAAVTTRYGVAWRTVDRACTRVFTEALAATNPLDGLTMIAIDEVKSKKGHKYLTVVSDHVTGRVVWVADRYCQVTLDRFFDQLGGQAQLLEFVTADGAKWVHNLVAKRAPQAEICLDAYHIVAWANEALDEVRRSQWRQLRSQLDGDHKAKSVKGLRFLLIRNWENLSAGEKGWIRDLERANRRLFRAWQLKEELRDILSMNIIAARRAIDDWIHYASRSRLPAFVKLARRIRRYRTSLEATIEWGLTNGIAESNNSVIGSIRTQARGFHHPDKFIIMIMLARGGLRPNLPWAPTQTP